MKRFFNILDNSFNRDNNFTTLQNARLDVVGELEAIVQYEAHLSQTNVESAKRAISDIIKEEKLHVGQLMGLIFKLDPESKEQFYKGLEEFNEEDDK